MRYKKVGTCERCGQAIFEKIEGTEKPFTQEQWWAREYNKGLDKAIEIVNSLNLKSVTMKIFLINELKAAKIETP